MRPVLVRLVLAQILAIGAAGCERSSESDEQRATTSASVTRSPAPRPEPGPRLLYLPDGGDYALEGMPPPQAPLWAAGSGRCPPEMVDINAQFCIDRYEASLIDAKSNQPLSPYYHPRRAILKANFERWQRRAQSGVTALARQLAIPIPPRFQLEDEFEPKAVSMPGVVPNGYLSGIIAERACRSAGKRLCARHEWLLACRGQRQLKFPYGNEYVDGRCNVLRQSHPARLLHNDASINHLDPRLNLVGDNDGPLLKKTGATPSCRSDWGTDAVFDMVGNLDEWIDDPSGAFRGGFFSRGTREGCDAEISSHVREYYDYSLGVRCCL